MNFRRIRHVKSAIIGIDVQGRRNVPGILHLFNAQGFIHEHRTTKTRKCRYMLLLCIYSHFAMQKHSKKDGRRPSFFMRRFLCWSDTS